MFSIIDDFHASNLAGDPFDVNVVFNDVREVVGGVDYATYVYCEVQYFFQFEAITYISFCVEGKEAPAIEKYYSLVQNNTSNLLQKKLTEKSHETEQVNFNGDRTIVHFDAKSELKIFITGYSELAGGIKQSAAMLLDCLLITASKGGLRDTLVVLPLSEYMRMRRLSDIKLIREQARRDIDALERVSFEYRSDKRKNWLKIKISGGTTGQIKNGDILFRFNQDFFNSFKVFGNKDQFMYFPFKALQGNINDNPYKYWLGRKVSEHKRMNLGKTNEDKISVKTLIMACPNLPAYEDVASVNGNGNIFDRIIEPFERDMDALNEAFSWHYNNTDVITNYKDFISATITIFWHNYPDVEELRVNKVKRAKGQKSEKRGGGGVVKRG